MGGGLEERHIRRAQKAKKEIGLDGIAFAPKHAIE
jgi:hypothetical protein